MTTPRKALDTRRSEARLAAYRSREFVARRRVVTFTRNVPATAEEIFPQLCPTREYDWIDGWQSDLIFTETGYGEEMCVFETTEDNVTGPGLWTFSHVEAPRLLKIVRVTSVFLQHLCIELQPRQDGTTDTVWTATITALSAEGNRALRALPQDDEAFAGSADALAYFFAKRRRKPAAGCGQHGPSAPVHGLLSEAARWIRNHKGN